jgi:hypothetical protein
MRKIVLLLMVMAVSFSVGACSSKKKPRRKAKQRSSQEEERKAYERRAAAAYTDIVTKAEKLEKVADFKGAIEIYKQFPSEYDNTQYGTSIKQKIESRENRFKGEEEFPKMLEKVTDLEKQEKYKEALYEMNMFEATYGKNIYPNPFNARRARLERKYEMQKGGR